MRAILIEDEKSAREVIKSLLDRISQPVQLVGEAESVEQAVDLYYKTKPDLIFLDVQIKGGDAFDFLDKISPINAQIIFITAYNHYAFKAFQHEALHYLLKPITLNDLNEAINRAIPLRKETQNATNQIEQLLQSIQSATVHQKLSIINKDDIRFIDVNNIIYCMSDGNYTWIITTNKQKLISSKNLKYYEKQLEKWGFFRVHNRFIINLDQVDTYLRRENGTVKMSDGEIIPISRRRRQTFIELIGNHIDF